MLLSREKSCGKEEKIGLGKKKLVFLFHLNSLKIASLNVNHFQEFLWDSFAIVSLKSGQTYKDEKQFHLLHSLGHFVHTV